MKKFSLLIFFSLFCFGTVFSQTETETIFLSGTGEDDTVPWEFYCTTGQNSGRWTQIQVPSCWELQGFGNYNYGEEQVHSTEEGLYRKEFLIPEGWRGRRIFLAFEGVMTDAEVKVNGIQAGPVQQGAFYPSKYDITSLLKPSGANLLEVHVWKESSNKSINAAERKADYWIFGGIFRPVLLESCPDCFIDRVAIDASHTGEISADVFVDRGLSTMGSLSVAMKIHDSDGKVVKASSQLGFPGDSTRISLKVEGVKAWTAETPNLYKAEFTLREEGEVIHNFSQTFGFRKVELREKDGFYVNGVKIRFKGVCRHTFYPESGRTSSRRLAVEDVLLMKEMNMNAVRMSHYPPDRFFLDVCDSLGLYVIDELAGWGEAYDGQTARTLATAMVRRDVNHPCVVMWSNGNEGGFPVEARPVYGLIDIQKRQVVEPFSIYDGTDTRHYPGFAYSEKRIRTGDYVYMPTESLRGLNDGGHGAGLDDYWNLIMNSVTGAGMFLWNFADEGVVRTDKGMAVEVFIDKSPDGILGPHHEKEASFYTIKEIWSPIQIEKPDFSYFDGTFSVSNRYHFTNLRDCSFTGSLKSYPSPLDVSSVLKREFAISSPDVGPCTERALLKADLPGNWRDADVLSITACGPDGREVWTWTWPITPGSGISARALPSGKAPSVKVVDKGGFLKLSSKNWSFLVDKQTGMVCEALRKGKKVKFPSGPRFYNLEDEPLSFSHGHTPDGYVFRADCADGRFLKWTVCAEGWLRLDYAYRLDGDYAVAGITFDYPEEGIKEAVLLGDGPYRVWKNRLKGVSYAIHEKKYNDTVTGLNWDYPEFKGYYSKFTALYLKCSSGSLTILGEGEGQYLQLFRPKDPLYRYPSVNPEIMVKWPGISTEFPDGQISIVNCIPAIGTKFSLPEQEGPSGKPSHFEDNLIKGTIYLHAE